MSISLANPVPGWRNQNALRAYPFSSYADGIDTSGRALPAGAFVDAALYPMTPGTPRLVSVSFARRELEIAVGDLRLTGTWEPGAGEIWIAEAEAPYRGVGVLVLGPEAATLDGDFTFDAGHADFEAAVCTPLLQAGVRGFLLPDGTVVTGDVVIAGDDGVRVRTYNDAGVAYLRMDVIGYDATGTGDPGCHTCGVVRCLRVQNTDGSHVLVSPGDRVNGTTSKVALTMPDVDMSTLCGREITTLPSGRQTADEWCADVETPCPALAHAAAASTFVCPDNGHIHITAPSSLTQRNPLRITAEQRANPTPSVDLSSPTEDIDRVARRLARATSPVSQAHGAITVGLRTGGRRT